VIEGPCEHESRTQKLQGCDEYHMMSTSEDMMAARQALKAAKKELRTVMKKRLTDVSRESVASQSK